MGTELLDARAPGPRHPLAQAKDQGPRDRPGDSKGHKAAAVRIGKKVCGRAGPMQPDRWMRGPGLLPRPGAVMSPCFSDRSMVLPRQRPPESSVSAPTGMLSHPRTVTADLHTAPQAWQASVCRQSAKTHRDEAAGWGSVDVEQSAR